MLIITIISLVASLVTLFAVWGNITAIFYNRKHFRKGGIRMTYASGAYMLKSGSLDGKIIYKSSDDQKDFIIYGDAAMSYQIEEIIPFSKWSVKHWADDIRLPQYPLRLLAS